MRVLLVVFLFRHGFGAVTSHVVFKDAKLKPTKFLCPRHECDGCSGTLSRSSTALRMPRLSQKKHGKGYAWVVLASPWWSQGVNEGVAL